MSDLRPSALRSKIANHHKRAQKSGYSPEITLEISLAKRDLAAARLEEQINRILVEAPPLTAAQKARLAAILNEVSQ